MSRVMGFLILKNYVFFKKIQQSQKMRLLHYYFASELKTKIINQIYYQMKKKLFFLAFMAFIFMGVNAQTYWDLNGNPASASNFIGTTNNRPLIFKTNSTERMHLLPDKPFLGIGTSTPEATLHLYYQDGAVPPISQKLLQLTTSNTPNGFSIISNRTTNDIYFKQQEEAKFFIEGVGGGLAIAQDGKVGFGTDAPAEKLHISNGNLLISGQSSAIYNTPACALIFSDVIDNTYPFGRWGIEYCSSPAFDGLMFRRYGGAEGSNEVGDQQILLLSNDGKVSLNGRLGIGASTPLTNLQIGPLWTFQDRPNSSIMGRNTYFNGTGEVRINTGTASRISFNNTGEILLQTTQKDVANSTIRWNTVTVAANGDVGIGTIATPKAKLEVNGDFLASSATITGSLDVGGTLRADLLEVEGLSLPPNHDLKVNILTANRIRVEDLLCAHEVKVNRAPCWPDYVFSDSYHLMPLQDLKLFVNKNKHLPEVPSAATVEENGIELGQMNAIMLKKIEELTLYILDLQKQIDELKSR